MNNWKNDNKGYGVEGMLNHRSSSRMEVSDDDDDDADADTFLVAHQGNNNNNNNNESWFVGSTSPDVRAHNVITPSHFYNSKEIFTAATTATTTTTTRTTNTTRITNNLMSLPFCPRFAPRPDARKTKDTIQLKPRDSSLLFAACAQDSPLVAAVEGSRTTSGRKLVDEYPMNSKQCSKYDRAKLNENAKNLLLDRAAPHSNNYYDESSSSSSPSNGNHSYFNACPSRGRTRMTFNLKPEDTTTGIQAKKAKNTKNANHKPNRDNIADSLGKPSAATTTDDDDRRPINNYNYNYNNRNQQTHLTNHYQQQQQKQKQQRPHEIIADEDNNNNNTNTNNNNNNTMTSPVDFCLPRQRSRAIAIKRPRPGDIIDRDYCSSSRSTSRAATATEKPRGGDAEIYDYATWRMYNRIIDHRRRNLNLTIPSQQQQQQDHQSHPQPQQSSTKDIETSTSSSRAEEGRGMVHPSIIYGQRYYLHQHQHQHHMPSSHAYSSDCSEDEYEHEDDVIFDLEL